MFIAVFPIERLLLALSNKALAGNILIFSLLGWWAKRGSENLVSNLIVAEKNYSILLSSHLYELNTPLTFLLHAFYVT